MTTMRLLGTAVAHLLAVLVLVALTFLALGATAGSHLWYHPENPDDGDSDGYTLAALEVTLIVAAPVIVVTYAVALTVTDLMRRMQPQS